jgi:hypothetical protein
MPEWSGLGRMLILAGAVLALTGVLVLLAGKGPTPDDEESGLGWLGKLPGDIHIKRDNFSFYAPITTGLIISIAVSLLLYLVSSLWRR